MVQRFDFRFVNAGGKEKGKEEVEEQESKKGQGRGREQGKEQGWRVKTEWFVRPRGFRVRVARREEQRRRGGKGGEVETAGNREEKTRAHSCGGKIRSICLFPNPPRTHERGVGWWENPRKTGNEHGILMEMRRRRQLRV